MSKSNIKIDKRSDESVYITIGDWTVYLDNSTNERMITSWTEGEEEKNGRSKQI